MPPRTELCRKKRFLNTILPVLFIIGNYLAAELPIDMQERLTRLEEKLIHLYETLVQPFLHPEAVATEQKTGVLLHFAHSANEVIRAELREFDDLEFRLAIKGIVTDLRKRIRD